jgi:hypothetical protein
MVVGFNHNFSYKGVVYHIQTEDGGLGSPNIISLLYHGGTILASRKTSYADITKVDNLEKVVEDLMKEQHKGMLRSLKTGEFDEAIARFNAGQKKSPAPAAVRPMSGTAEQPVVTPQPEPAPASAPKPETGPVQAEGQDTSRPAAASTSGQERPTVEASLDEIILSYLMGDEK